jgi:DnaJ like chaperone protein
MPWAGMLLLIPVIAGCAIASTILNRGARRAAKQSAETPRKPQPAVYYDYNQYQQARQRWLHGNSSFALEETARLADLEAKLKQAGPLSGLGCLGFILLALLFGAAGGAGAGWGTVIVGAIVFGLLSACEERYRRWRWRDQFKRRVFADAVPEPIYAGPSPHQEQPPPPRQEPPPRPKAPPSPATTEPVRVTSLQQAFEILGIPPGHTTLSVARTAYRARIAEYHPDKTMHLGKAIRELAARKTLEINLAMKFIEENCTTRSSGPDQSAAGPSEPPQTKPEPSTQVLMDEIRRLKKAVPFRPFSIKTRKNDRAILTSDKWFFIRYPEWVSFKDETSVILWTANSDHKYEIPLPEIERVSQGVYEAGTHWEDGAGRKTEEAKAGNQNGEIYPEDSIVSAAEGDPRGIFLRGPFDSVGDDAFCDPYVEGLDYIEQNGHSYISINSWRGRIPYGTDEGSLLGNEIFELPSRGGWDSDRDYAWEEVYCGGADVIPHYDTQRIAVGLREFLRTAPNEIEFEGRTISRDTLLQAASILEAGPTTIPW